MYCEFVGLGLEQRAGDANDVADVPVLEALMHLFADAVIADEDLDTAGDVLNGGKAGLAHHALEHDAAGDLDFDRRGFKFFAGFGGVKLVQTARHVLAREIVGEGFAGGAPLGEFLAALGDQMIFVDGGRCGRLLVLAHGVVPGIQSWRISTTASLPKSGCSR